jgi:hypothetical protein
MKELAELNDMTVGELAEKYLEVFGEPRTTTRNKEYFRKQIAWRLQERAEGGLSARAVDRIEKIAPEAPARWRPAVGTRRRQLVSEGVAGEKDSRLPAPGAVLSREYGGVNHQVTVREEGFEYEGQRYRSLSAVAKRITGSSWNGYVFFLGRGAGNAGGGR